MCHYYNEVNTNIMAHLNESYDPKYLVCVTSSNNNKFYRILPDPDSQGFTVEYGRIGAPSFRTDHYPIDMYWRKYDEKLKKGYVDQTNLVKAAVAATSGEDGFKAIADKSVNELVQALRRYASDTIKQNYTISQSAVTQEMLDKAEELIDKLNSIADSLGKGNSSYQFNDTLIRLFKTIPRKMNKVNDYLLHGDDAGAAAKIIDREQKLYDVLLANFQTQQVANAKDASKDDGSTSSGPTETILEKFGLECEPVVDQSKIDEIKRHLGQVAPKFKRAFVVVNKKTQDKYASFMASNPNCKTKLFFHGSKNENFWSILKNGLLLNPKASVTGKMLGNGVYFSPTAIKSLNYTSLQGSYWSGGNSKIGYMAIFAVAIDTKNCYEVTTSSEISSCYGMTWDKLQKKQPGATYVYAHGGPGKYLRADELCIYREDQCTIRYLVELHV